MSLDRDEDAETGKSVLTGWRDKMCALADRVGFSQPLKELLVELMNSGDPEVVHEKALRVRTGTSDASVLNATLEVEIPVEGSLPWGRAGETTATSLQADRSLRDRVVERTARLGKFDETPIESNDMLGLVVQVTLDGPLVDHASEATRPNQGEDSPLREFAEMSVDGSENSDASLGRAE